MNDVIVNNEMLKDILEKHYNINATDEQITDLDSGSFNKVWKVTNDDKSYVLKKINHSFNENWVKWADEIFNSIYKSNKLLLIKNKNESFFTYVKDEDSLWSLSEFIISKPFELRNIQHLEQARLALKNIQEIDLNTTIHLNDETIKKVKRNEIFTWEDPNAFSEFKNLLKECKFKDFDQEQLILKIVEECIGKIKALNINDLNLVVSHGEFQGQNILFDNNGSINVIDWDGIGLRPKIYDIAVSAVFLTRKKRGSFILDEITFNEYIQKFALTREEIESIPYLIPLYFAPSKEFIDNFNLNAPEKLDWYLEWSFDAMISLNTQLKKIV